MKRLTILIIMCTLLFAQTTLEYKEKYKDPVHAKLKELRQTKTDAKVAITDEIIDAREDDPGMRLFASTEAVIPPESIEEFNPYFHFPPKHQGLTGSCWAHTGISFIESEMERKYGKEIKLSVIYIVYWDAYQKSRHFIETRGEYDIRQGSQINGTFKVAEEFGLLPQSVYDGNFPEEGYDTGPLYDELHAYLDHIKENDLWDMETNLISIKAILNKHLGELPEEFKFQGKSYNATSFYRKVVKFDPENYCGIQSTLYFPFNEYHHFPYPDHWWKGNDFYNLPIDEFYAVILNAVKSGYSVPIGGDTSEPGYNRYEGIAFIPDVDIPVELINQESREYRIDNETTGDDHAVHIVGHIQIDGIDWFLIKDSSRSAYQSEHPGYYFYRGDYIKLKMLNAIVPKKLVTRNW